MIQSEKQLLRNTDLFPRIVFIIKEFCLILHFRKIHLDPQFYHACFVSKTNYEKRLLEIPKKPPMFCMLLRKCLENAVISRVEQPQFERILEFYIETYNELSEKILKKS